MRKVDLPMGPAQSFSSAMAQARRRIHGYQMSERLRETTEVTFRRMTSNFVFCNLHLEKCPPLFCFVLQQICFYRFFSKFQPDSDSKSESTTDTETNHSDYGTDTSSPTASDSCNTTDTDTDIDTYVEEYRSTAPPSVSTISNSERDANVTHRKNRQPTRATFRRVCCALFLLSVCFLIQHFGSSHMKPLMLPNLIVFNLVLVFVMFPLAAFICKQPQDVLTSPGAESFVLPGGPCLPLLAFFVQFNVVLCLLGKIWPELSMWLFWGKEFSDSPLKPSTL